MPSPIIHATNVVRSTKNISPDRQRKPSAFLDQAETHMQTRPRSRRKAGDKKEANLHCHATRMPAGKLLITTGADRDAGAIQ